MSITNILISGNPTHNSVLLEVVESGLNLSVDAGQFVVGGEQYSLTEPQEFTAIADVSFDTRITGYLVHDVAANAQVLLVDEVLLDNITQSYVFDGNDYRLIHRLFETTLPASATAFDEVLVYNIVSREDS